MAISNDVRAVLQYVPLFRGRTFVVLVEAHLLPEPAIAETLLDLSALEEIGIKFVLGILGGEADDLYDWTIECEMKSALLDVEIGDPAALSKAQEIIERGQTVVAKVATSNPLDDSIINFSLGLGAVKLIALLDETILYHGHPLHAVHINQVEKLLESPDISGQALLKDALHACRRGLPRVHILNGHKQGVLVEELFSNEGVGTMVHTDDYQEIRSLREEDIPELLGMIGRSVRRTKLIPRSYEDIIEKISDYYVITVDDNVVGCIALHEHPDYGTAELACLYVKHSHEDRGYGRLLVEYIENLARKKSIPHIYALTTQAIGFFRNRVHFQEATPDILPPSRRQQLDASGRHSKVFVKKLNKNANGSGH